MTENQPKLAYIGLGLMGGPMATRLAAAGFQIAVWNRSEEKTRPAVAAGARLATSPSDAATGTDIIFTCLTDTDAVEAVAFGPGGIAEVASKDMIVVDFSSMKPEKAAEFASRLRAETGAGWVDAPVSGGVPGATNGTLTIMAGGEEADFIAVQPLIEAHLAARFTLMGPNGAGQTTKLINQMMVGGMFALLAEATQLAKDGGVDAGRIPAALAGGRADSPTMQHFMPKMARSDYTLEGAISIMVKDLNTVQETARRQGTPIPMTSLALELHRILAKRGHAGADNAAMIRLYNDKDT
ncbi:MAG: NAD(P)-dependent oxidoreductase [Rhodospirillaceae bacterium]|nr:NAD(P)-dependent oxidoreductase [Rhodospirillaceae bacterium]MBT6140176.1 NAD(P)-dependent oxidoreductase [Rhodospirillaceae bacterium]